jgi:hypothetical protein
MSTHFVGETIEPVAETFDARGMARGEPGVPRRFRWRGEEHEVAAVLETTKETGACTHGSAERYVTKHRFRVRTTSGLEMALSFDRRARTPKELRAAWCLHSVTDATAAADAHGAVRPRRS